MRQEIMALFRAMDEPIADAVLTIVALKHEDRSYLVVMRNKSRRVTVLRSSGWAENNVMVFMVPIVTPCKPIQAMSVNGGKLFIDFDDNSSVKIEPMVIGEAEAPPLQNIQTCVIDQLLGKKSTTFKTTLGEKGAITVAPEGCRFTVSANLPEIEIMGHKPGTEIEVTLSHNTGVLSYKTMVGWHAAYTYRNNIESVTETTPKPVKEDKMPDIGDSVPRQTVVPTSVTTDIPAAPATTEAVKKRRIRTPKIVIPTTAPVTPPVDASAQGPSIESLTVDIDALDANIRTFAISMHDSLRKIKTDVRVIVRNNQMSKDMSVKLRTLAKQLNDLGLPALK